MTNSDEWELEWCQRIGSEAAQLLSRAHVLSKELPQPNQRLADLRRFVMVHTDAVTVCRDLNADPLALDVLFQVSVASRYGFETMLRWPGDFWHIFQERQFRQVWGRRTLANHLAHELSTVTDDDAKRRMLARFKHRHFLRVILGDLAGSLRFESVVAEISDITDVLAQSAFALAAQDISKRHHCHLVSQPLGDQASGLYRVIVPEKQKSLGTGFTVLAFGKHGARELNYSSDIDLVFVYHVAPDHVQQRDWHEVFVDLGKRIIALLERPDDGAAMYRVDLRLRPEGERGELVLNLRETIDYYYSVGRPWERQALIKARPIAGDLELGQRLLDELRPWVYPQEPDWATLDEARSMRRRIEERAREHDVKTGAGGIRDIEFLVQFFQLSFGGRQPELRLRATLPTLRMLSDRGILPRAHASELEQHYIWLRTVEHRLQMFDDRQEHEVPRDIDARRRLAWACDGCRIEDFEARLAEVRTRVRALVSEHFLTAGQEQDAALALMVQGEAHADLSHRVLGGYGFKDIARAAQAIKALATEPFFVLARHRTERALVTLLPDLLSRIAQTPSPDQALADFVRIVTAVGGRATFFELLVSKRRILDLITGFAGWAAYLVELLARFPGLTDEIVDALSTAPRPASVLAGEARALIQGLANPTEPLAFMVARESAVTALRDLDGLEPAQVSERLTALAEAIITTVLARIVAEQSRAWGFPETDGRPTRFAILGLGKLGGREMTYGSDLDVVFVCEPGGRCAKSDHDGEEFWTHVAQALMRHLQASAGLYDLDPRLRPWGDQGQLVVNTKSFTGYWSEPRDLWERMAMLRAAPLAGDLTFATEVTRALQSAAYEASLPVDAAAQVIDMRRRLEHSVKGRDHVKRGHGGYVDHEFIAQYFCLGKSAAEVLTATDGSTSTAEVLAALGRLGRIPAEAAADLAPGLMFLRFVEGRLRLHAGKAVSAIPTETVARAELARRCGFSDTAALDAALHQARTTARRWFTTLIGAM